MNKVRISLREPVAQAGADAVGAAWAEPGCVGNDDGAGSGDRPTPDDAIWVRGLRKEYRPHGQPGPSLSRLSETSATSAATSPGAEPRATSEAEAGHTTTVPGTNSAAGARDGDSADVGSVVALAHLDLTVPRGSIYGFLGPNGAGKTTTIRLLLGQLRPTAGTIHLLGQRVTWERPDPLPLDLRRRISYLPQDPVFPRRHTGLEVMQLVADLYGLDPTAAHQRTHELLALLDLDQASRRRVDTYSRGMKQRLGLAVALLPEPELLLLDEPVSALDPVGRHQILELLVELRRQGTVFFSSHILADVERICDHVAILNQGQKVLEGPLHELLKQYDPRRYRLRIRPDQWDSALARLEQAPWAQQVQPVDQPAGVFEIAPRPGGWAQMEQELVSTLAAAGITVLECYPLRADLETVFLQLLPGVQQQGAAGSGV